MQKEIIIVGALLLCSCTNNDYTSFQIETNESTFVDYRDGKEYKCVTINNQTWMAENLVFHLPKGSVEGCYTFNEESMSLSSIVDIDEFTIECQKAVDNGSITDPIGVPFFDLPTNIIRDFPYFDTAIEHIDYILTLVNKYPQHKEYVVAQKIMKEIYSQLEEAGIGNAAKEHFQLTESTNGNYSKTHGLLYTYTAALAAVPQGWRLPSDSDWKQLEQSFGLIDKELDKLNSWRSTKKKNLLSEIKEKLNLEFKLSGLRLIGDRFSWQTPYINKETCAYYWTSEKPTILVNVEGADTLANNYVGIMRKFEKNNNSIYRGTIYSNAALSVRLIKE